MPEDTSPIHRRILTGLEADTSRELMPELIAVFIRSADARALKITEHMAAGRLDGIAAEAHALKSSAATFGAGEVRRISAELEAAGKIGDRPAAERLTANLIQALDAAKRVLDAYVQEISE